jgi:hypothetical protein
MKKPETIEEYEKVVSDMGKLLVECRDAIVYMPMTAVRLGQVSPSLATRIENVLEPWIDPNGI